MDVDFRIGRDIDIDHCFELRDIQAACRYVGGDQYRATTISELNQHLVAFALFHIAI